MKRLLRPLVLCLAMIALPVQGIAGTVMMICGAAPGTGVAAMMSRHAAVKSQVEAQWRTQSQHAHCHDGDAQDAGAAADNASGATLEPEHADHAGQANAADRPDHAGWAVNDMDGDGPGDPGNPDDNGMAHHHANNGCTACASCALGAALPVGPLDLALSHYRHTLPRSASATMADIRLDTLLRPPADRC